MSAAALQPGDQAPFCFGMAADKSFYSSDQQAGRPAAMILAGALPVEVVAPLVQAFSSRSHGFHQVGADVLLVVSARAMQWVDVALPYGLRLIHCAADAIFTQAGLDSQPVVLAIDRAQTLVARLTGGLAETMADQALACAAALRAEPAPEVTACAPALMIPHLFNPALCSDLIARFEAGDHSQGAMASIDTQGQAVNRIDAGKKHRRDCTLDDAEAIHAQVLDILSRRLVPEIKRAYQIDIAHVDRVLIARYDDTGGYFRRHRDNTAPQVAFRQFALSVNLNTHAYEGGHLLFPEYTDHRYNPPAGAGIVFSASLLHEAAPVTRGSRYVLLTFLHDDAAELRRRQGLQATAQAA